MSRCLLFIVHCSLFISVGTYADHVEMHFDLDPIGQKDEGGVGLRQKCYLHAVKVTL